MASNAKQKPKPKPKSKAQPTTQNQSKSQAAESERLKETSQAAQKSLEAQRKAHELAQAAAACGDPNVRQKLLNEALEKEVEAETFGKTARYLQTGAFQGLCAGAGLGGGIGVSLGVITGTLVGGTTSLVTGGLGAGLGLGFGAAHGAWFRVGDLMGGAIRKVTGDLPGWKATEEQKQALEKMVNGVQEQERPDEEELVRMTEGSKGVVPGKGYTGMREEDEKEEGMLRGAADTVTSIPGELNPLSKSKRNEGGRQPKSKVQNVSSSGDVPRPATNNLVRQDLAGKAATPQGPSPQTNTNVKPLESSLTKTKTDTGEEKAPGANMQDASRPKRQPRKLEIRSKK